MSLLTEILLAFLAAALLLGLYRRLLTPTYAGTVPFLALLPLSGDGETAEQTLRHLRWLQQEELASFTILVVDAGLTPAGLETLRALARKDPDLLFCPPEETTLILKRKDDHDCCTL